MLEQFGAQGSEGVIRAGVGKVTELICDKGTEGLDTKDTLFDTDDVLVSGVNYFKIIAFKT